MFVSKKKLKALVDENIVLKKQNRELIAKNKRLFDSDFDLRWENKMLRMALCKKKGQKCGEYFYGVKQNG
ncbi:MAG: hypothetical protein IJW86_09685 [Clostridia bacterium]|nr:hypothetical protein [Clostridia bacterium]